MQTLEKCLMKINGMRAAIVFFSSILFSGYVESSMPVFTVELFNRPLTLYSAPIQNAQANSNFTFNLNPYISVIQPEVDYRVTNNAKRTFDGIELIELPRGLTRVYAGENVCSEFFTLNAGQSCILRFYVDKNTYVHSLRGGPIVCFRPPAGSCSRPSADSQIDDAVARVPGPTQALVNPFTQDGLHYNPYSLAIEGKPTRTGVYLFTVSATNGSATTAAQDVQINVDINPYDKPVFKHHYTLASAMPEHEYRLNLMDLIEPTLGFSVTNQVKFRIDLNHEYPSWLSLDKENVTFLHGHVPASDAGQIKEITLIATSNTGGDSQPLTIRIPVAFDPEKKPVIEKGIELTGSAGAPFHYDFRSNIIDPTADANLKLILDKVEPEAPWLSMSSWNPTELDGIVPKDAEGKTFQLTFYANTAVGGNSDPINIPLNISIDPDKTPHFYSDSPKLPIFYAGQPYFYDFVDCNDIDPEYANIPYTVELAKGYNNPEWLRIEDNKLIADRVPDNLKKMQQMFITIKNIPGGESKVFSLPLFIMK